jgi:hypothetical protein
MHTSSEVEFDIKACLSEDLSTRNRTAHFFEMMGSSDATSVVVNFAQVKSITRSFADEYVKRKRASKLNIQESNVPNNVQKMFEIVSAPADKKRVVNIANLRIDML